MSEQNGSNGHVDTRRFWRSLDELQEDPRAREFMEREFPEGAWELVGSFNATQDDEYVFRSQTLADSTGAGIPWSVYIVSAHTTNTAVWFVSEPDSGYSVDNIAPMPPRNAVVAYNEGGSGGNKLVWDPAPEEDFKHYAVYRGTEPSFTLSQESFLVSTSSSGWTDPSYGSGVYYKITAIDTGDVEIEVEVGDL